MHDLSQSTWRILGTILLLFGLGISSLIAQPTGFAQENYATGFANAIGLTFDTNGKMYVWEKGGRIWIVDNGVKSSQPLLDISEEVGNWRDFGLMSVALDPNFLSNGYIYLLYTVDRHHLMNFGTPSYSATTNEYYAATIGRVTRYTATAASGFTQVDYASRKILIGEDKKTGIPSLHESHGIGSLVFGTDGTLLVTAGDGASYSTVDEGSVGHTYYSDALSDTIIQSFENVGAYRCQQDSSLNGKLLRIDPATGDGVPSNPMYDAGNPRSPQSRTWAKGLRNPCRATLRPNTGSHYEAAGDPGVLYIGDVGWGNREELNVCDAPSLNFGWPKYEGMTNQPGYNNAAYEPPVHELPKVDWRNGTARGVISGTIYNVGTLQFPGNNFGGNCSMGGTWYTGTDFPVEYQDKYYHLDYGGKWIKIFDMDNNNDPIEVIDFWTNTGAITYLGTNPVSGSLYYVNNGGTVYRIYYSGTGDQKPTAIATGAPQFGVSPLTVNFAGGQSSDPEGLPLTYAWDFGDGNGSTVANPSHVFTASGSGPEAFTVTLTVTDQGGQTDQTTLIISLNNTPPVINSVSLDTVDIFPMSNQITLPLEAAVTDAEHSGSDLTYAWQTALYHDNHNHPEPIDNNENTSAVLSPVGCDGVLYFYRIELTVTDAAGLSDTYYRDIYPDCGGPIAQNDTGTFEFGSNVVVDILGNDQNGAANIDPSTVNILKQPLYGTLAINNGTGAVTYTHNGVNTEHDLFLYEVEDLAGNTSGVAEARLELGGDPAISISEPTEGDVIFGTSVDVSFESAGELLGNESVRLEVDGGSADTVLYVNGSYTFTGLPYGNHQVIAGLLDASDIPLANDQARDTVNFVTSERPEPGNVGQNLTLWYRADKGVVQNLDGVTTWEDQSLNEFDVLQGTAGNQPGYDADGLNYNPVVTFDGNDYLNLDNVLGGDLFDPQEATIFVAQEAAGVVSFSFGDGGSDNKVVVENCGARMDFASTVLAGSNAGLCDVAHIHTGRADNGDFEVIIDGVQLTNGTFTKSINPALTNNLEIGAHNGNYFVTGKIAEVIVYRKALTDAAVDSVLTYLSIKYGMGIDVASHLYYSQAGFPEALAGIGRDMFFQDLEQPMSRSSLPTDPLIIGNPTDLQDGDYKVWGHDGGTTDLIYTDVPAGTNARLERIWAFENTGTPGNVDVMFDLNSIALPVSDPSNIFLLVDLVDDNMADATVVSPASLVDGVVTFVGQNLPTGAKISLAIDIPCLPHCDDFTIGGDATVSDLGCYQLTPATGNQSGVMWFDSLANLSEDFRIEVEMYLGDNDAGADGIAFSFHNDPEGIGFVGGAGGGFGLGGLVPSLNVEFDTYKNGVEMTADHISIFQDGGQANVLTAAVQASATNANIEDGAFHTVIIDWDEATTTLEVYFDGSLRATYTGDIVTDIFGGTEKVVFGFSAATGGAVNVQTVCLTDLQGKFHSPDEPCVDCDAADFVNNGSSQHAATTCLRLTQAGVNNDVGATWHQERANLSSPFQIEFNMSMSDDDAGADGMTFSFHQDPEGTAAMGSYGLPMGVNGVSPSFSVEFDNYNNGAAGNSVDLADDHLTFFYNGNQADTLRTPVCIDPACANVEDGTDRLIMIDWNPTTEILQVYVDGNLRMSIDTALVDDFFGGDPLVYFGFTAATGGQTCTHMVCIESLTFTAAATLPIELLSFDAEVVNGQVALDWATASEENNHFFTVERSEDGESFQDVAKVQGAGTTNSISTYETVDTDPLIGRSFYRLRQTDLDGRSALSNMVEVFVDPTSGAFSLNAFPNPSDGMMTLSYRLPSSKPAELMIFNAQGQMVKRMDLGSQEGLHAVDLDLTYLAKGVYMFRMVQDGESLTQSVILQQVR
ncbi:lectin-like domain-containing protein [Pontibacter sp. G13]|uniref:lectin-like domain-containing protein n=1 Tax=Pontibacter sp. G13 TaxID=3074898 RepID=UPI00288A28C5|nr:PQQ-dependent sugar dehydrogenase [Pontibacter sp. G13]WNJ17664.1 PQQ-dependent sugar dehydrogenase [Pontibacter sp. G13]